MAIRCPLQTVVVHEDGDIVSRELDIHFHAPVSEAARESQAGQCVFGCQGPAPTVGNDGREWPARGGMGIRRGHLRTVAPNEGNRLVSGIILFFLPEICERENANLRIPLQ
jgi:hypothetical protein